MSALVTPGNLRSALAVTRSLGRRGITVTVADECLRSLAGASRYCQRSIRVPSPSVDGDAFVANIIEDACKAHHQVVIPTDDVSLWVLAQARERFEGIAALPVAALEAIQVARDKNLVMKVAEKEGIRIPRTVVVQDPGDLSPAIQEVGFPAVVKARFSRFDCGSEWVNGGGTHYVHTLAELEAAVRTVHEKVPFPLVQEYIRGEGRGVFLLMNHGKVRVAFAHRRIREKPPSGGVSVLSESVAMDPDLLEYSKRLLEPLKWHGVAMVEFKGDSKDRTAKLLEINGRFWGSLQLAVDAGIDFPYLLYRLAVDGDVEPVMAYREGVRLRWDLGNLDWLLLRLREGGRSGGRLGAIREFLRSSGAVTRAEVARWDDLRPAVEEFSQYVGHLARGGFGVLRSGKCRE